MAFNSSHKKKSNAEKIEKYLQRCFEHPIVSISTLLRDFLAVQREEDRFLPVSTTTIDSKPPTPTPAVVIVAPPSPTEQSIVDSHHNDEDEQGPNNRNKEVSLDDYELLKVLGKGCMGKVRIGRRRRHT